MNPVSEQSLTEQSLLDWFKAEGYEHVYGPDINPGQPRAERDTFRTVVLKDRLLGALRRLNPQLPAEEAEAVVREIVGYGHADLVLGNKEIYSWFTEGKKHMWQENGVEKNDFIQLVDFVHPEANEFLVVNQFTVQGADTVCRLDVVVFINGLPVTVFELKSASREESNVASAYQQLERYKKQIPKLFLYNQILAVSDLHTARYGTISSAWERYGTWKGIATADDATKDKSQLHVLVKGLFNKERLLDVLQNFVVFEADGDDEITTFTKKICLYHQYYAVNKTVASTLRSVHGEQERKIGVFWHTQGSGKSLSMVFYVNKTKHLPELKSPAYIFLTDRTDLDNQLYKTFKRTGYGPLAKRIEAISELHTTLNQLGSELIFTTIQKFRDVTELLSERVNTIVIADEAHRTQYSDLAWNVRQALPNASFMGVTGTPITESDRDTITVFGEVISSYKISQSVKDEATVPIYYEGRLVPLHLADSCIDEKLDDLLSEVVVDEKARMRQEWAVLEEIVGAQSRIAQVAKDIVYHFTSRPIQGKAMVVTMSRRIAVAVYQEIQKIPGAPECAVVISNGDEFASGIQAEHSVKRLEERFKKNDDPLKIAIVCDMWLTGFDVPCLQTMYLDKPLKNHGLMQAIARVNRVFKGKLGGLVVDYIGIAEHLHKALAIYDSDVQRTAMVPLAEIINDMQALYIECQTYLVNIDYSGWKKLIGSDLNQLIQAGINEVISKDGRLSDAQKESFITAVDTLISFHTMAMPNKIALNILDDVRFFKLVRLGILKNSPVTKAVFTEETDDELRSLVHGAISAEGVIDLFSKDGEQKSISIFDENFAAEIRKARYQNVVIDMVRKALGHELTLQMKTNSVRFETMFERLNRIIGEYENNIISSAAVIKNLLEIASEIKRVDADRVALGLSVEEITFYDTLARDADFKNMGIDIKEFVQDLVQRVRRDLAIDWTDNETIKARIRQNVRLLLLQKGIIDTIKSERLTEAVYQEIYRVYREFQPT